METNEVLKILNDPTVYEINKYAPRAHKSTYNKEGKLAIDLTGQWHFEFFEDILKRDQNFMNKDTFAGVISVPAHIEMSGYGKLQYVNTQYPWDGVEDVKVGESPLAINTCGQYTKYIEIENVEAYHQYIISFDGVESAFNIWVNGHYVGYSTDTFTTCEFEIKKYLQDGINKISVEVYKFSSSSWLEDQDFWRFSGIFRDVKIIKVTNQHIVDYEVKYEVTDNKVIGTIDFIKNGDFTVNVSIFEGQELVFETSSNQDQISFEVQNPTLWNPEQPHLYEFKIETAAEKFSKRIGFRTIEIIDKVIKFNKKRIVFKGMNRHEFNAYTGRAISYEETKKDLLLLKEHNFNAIRCSHYPNNPFFYDLCDEIGFYVIDEVNLETHGTWMVNGSSVEGKDDILPGDNIDYRDNVLKRAINLYNRDKNNTSVIMWSLGNESYGGKTLYEMHNYFKDVDKSRLVHYEGVWWDRTYPETSDVETQMYARSEVIEEYLNGDFKKPYLLCEYTHAMGNSNGNLTDYLDLEDKYQSYHGGFIWEYMDQAIYKDGEFLYGGDFEDRPTDYNFICDGLVGPNREITNELKYVSNLFSPIRIKEDQTSFTLKNNNVFKQLSNLKVVISEQTENYQTRLDQYTLSLDPQQEIKLEKLGYDGVTLYQVYDRDKLVKQFTEVNYQEKKAQSTSNDCHFVDGDCNFGLQANNFSVLFSKVHNNLISIKYDGKEIIESIERSPKPNLWRAPTNNDVGAGYDKKLSIWNLVSNYQSAKITDYCYEDEKLNVNIEFTHLVAADYKVEVKYIVSSNGEIEVTSKFNKVSNLPELFNFGFALSINQRYQTFNYLGYGPIESYCDRNAELPKMYNTVHLSEQNSYLYPQEYANRCGVNYLKVIDETNHGFIIESNEEFEFALRDYSDKELEFARNRSELKKNAPFLRVNMKQSGVAGDDSWGSWCKPENIVKSDQDHQFTVKIKPY